MLSKSRIKTIKSLSVKKYRDELGLFVAEGDKLVSELLASEFKREFLYITAKSTIEHKDAEVISESEMKKISGLKTPSPAFAVFNIPNFRLDIGKVKDDLVIALDNVQDPGNLGTIIRIADWFGIRHIICSQHCADCYAPKTIQATMGSIIRTKVYYSTLDDVLNQAKTFGTHIYGTFLTGKNIYAEKLSNKGIIVMGSEGKGISPEIEQLITKKLHIPQFGGENTSESLNVASATAIVCSEFRRNNI